MVSSGRKIQINPGNKYIKKNSNSCRKEIKRKNMLEWASLCS